MPRMRKRNSDGRRLLHLSEMRLLRLLIGGFSVEWSERKEWNSSRPKLRSERLNSEGIFSERQELDSRIIRHGWTKSTLTHWNCHTDGAGVRIRTIALGTDNVFSPLHHWGRTEFQLEADGKESWKLEIRVRVKQKINRHTYRIMQ